MHKWVAHVVASRNDKWQKLTFDALITRALKIERPHAQYNSFEWDGAGHSGEMVWFSPFLVVVAFA